MTYQSVDSLQRALAESIFSNRQDVKKAAGRALGTIVELITFYIFREWGFLENMSIERGLAEFANDAVTHNVEFGIHPILSTTSFSMTSKLPLSSSKIEKCMAQVKELQAYVAGSKAECKGAPRRLVWKPTFTIVSGGRARWACGQVAQAACPHVHGAVSG